MKSKFAPITPAGTVIWHLAKSTEEEAWAALMKDAAHMPYRDKAGFQRRGYTVSEFVPAKSTKGRA